MILSAIVAMSRNRVIGANNKLPWHIPEDFKFYREKTKGRILISGRKTLESLPGALPGRFQLIISRQNGYCPPARLKLSESDYRVVGSMAEALELAEAMLSPNHPLHRPGFGSEVFVNGGAEIYKESLAVLDRIYLTEIDMEVDGDTYFPEFDKKLFQLKESIQKSGPPSFAFNTYERVNA